MSSGFVSGGTNDAPIQRDDAWLKAQLELEAERKAKADAAKAANEGRSLFETLEANKAAKQEAFEEANRLKNQFRALDDDEVAFLDEIRAKERIEAAKVKKETAEGLEKFRKMREEAEKVERERNPEVAKADPKATAGDWNVRPKKRKAETVKSKLDLGIKVRKLSAGAEDKKEDVEESKSNGDIASKEESKASEPSKQSATPTVQSPDEPTKGGSKLVAYASDDDDDW